jgi:acyl-CoA synthetase (AMP-forming)/AMP-acid ligase II
VFFNDELQRAFKKYASPVAFAAKPDRMTVEAAAAAVDRIVEWLENNGIGRGDRVAALTRNRMEAVLLEWAVYRIGAIWIGIPAREREAENFRHILADFSPSLIFYEDAVVEQLGDVFCYFDGVSYEDIALPEGIDPIRYRALRRQQSPLTDIDFRVAGEPIVRIRYTSGTSGERKAIAYTQHTLAAMFKNISELIVQGHEETMVHITPIVWATGSLIAPVFCNGGKNVFVDPWDVRDFAYAVMEEERSLTFCVPSQVAEMTRFSVEKGAAWSTSLRRVLVAGAPTPVPIMRQAKRILPHVDFFMTLGQTEASFPITWHEVADSDLEAGPGKRPLVPLGRLTEPYRDSTVDPETGELLLVGAAVAGGKWIRPRHGAVGRFEPLRRPHATGDVVERDGDGRLHYVGRKASLPERKLGWPAPDAIEAIVNECAGIHRSRVDGLQRNGDDVVADLMVEPTGLGVEESSIREHFERWKSEANLAVVSLGTLRFGEVELTMAGKMKRPPLPGG